MWPLAEIIGTAVSAFDVHQLLTIWTRFSSNVAEDVLWEKDVE